MSRDSLCGSLLSTLTVLIQDHTISYHFIMNRLTSPAWTLVVLGLLLTQGSQASHEECRDATVPPTKPRGVNRVDRSSNSPLFQLHVTPTDSSNAYRVHVAVDTNSDTRISEAVLSVASNGSCGPGDFDFSHDDFVEVVQEQGSDCPRLIQTTRRTRDMTQLRPLVWIPPSCGCVLFRILLVTSSQSPVYYAENEAVTSGPLARSICISQGDSTAKLSRERRLESLCHVLDKRSSGEIMSRDHFARHRGLDSRWMDHYGMEMALELRRADVKDCCMKKLSNQRMDCFDDVRRRRIDDFCRDGRSDIPFRNFRRGHMRRLEKSCCFLLGELRYQCFAKDSEMTQQTAATGGTSSLDFSMDASDVVNDLADFGSHQHLDENLLPKNDAKIPPYSMPTVEKNEEKEEAESESEEMDGKEYPSVLFRKENVNIEEDDLSKENEAPSEFSAPFKHQRPANQNAVSKSRDTDRILKRKDEKMPIMTQSTHLKRRVQHMRGKIGSRDAKKLWRKARKQIKRTSIFNQSEDKVRKSKGERKRKQRKNKSHRRDGNSLKKNTKRTNRQRKAEENDFMRKVQKERKIAMKTTKKGSKQDLQRVSDRKQLSPMTPGDDILKSIGGDSSDRTLRRLQRKMRRLRLLNECCSSGSSAGSRVYGGLEQVTAECKHSAGKFVVGESMRGKTARKCRIQFEQCCGEAAKTGLTMSSHEFPEAFPMDDQNYNGIHAQMDDRLKRLRQQVPTIYQSLGELRHARKSEISTDNEPNEVLQIWDLVAKVQDQTESRPPALFHRKKDHWNSKVDRAYHKQTSSPTNLGIKKLVQPNRVTAPSPFDLKREQERIKAIEAVKRLGLSNKGDREQKSTPSHLKQLISSVKTNSLQTLDLTTASTITASPKMENVGQNSKLKSLKHENRQKDTYFRSTETSRESKKHTDDVLTKGDETKVAEERKTHGEKNSNGTKRDYQTARSSNTKNQYVAKQHNMSSARKEIDAKQENLKAHRNLPVNKLALSSQRETEINSSNVFTTPSQTETEKKEDPAPTLREHDTSYLTKKIKLAEVKEHYKHGQHLHRRHHKQTKSSKSTQFPRKHYQPLTSRLALDSREMAERNAKTKTVVGQLDSREMAEKYNKESNHHRLASLRPRPNISKHRRFHRRRSMWF